MIRCFILGANMGSGKQQTQLECHGFVCSSSEDAIIIAANLYQALLETMKKQKQRVQQQQHQEQQRRKEISAGLERSSDTRKSGRKAVVRTPSGRKTPTIRPPSRFGRGGTDSESIISRSQSRADPPVRPPRRKKLGYRSGGTSGSEYSTSGVAIGVPGSILRRRQSIRSSIRSNRSNRSNRIRAGTAPSTGKPTNTIKYGELDDRAPPRPQIIERRQGYSGYNPENRYRGPQSLTTGGLNRSDSRRSSRRAVVAASTAAARMQYHKQVFFYPLF